MATSSFNKNFILDSKKAVDSFTEILESCNSNKIEINRNYTSTKNIKRGEEKLKRILSR